MDRLALPDLQERQEPAVFVEPRALLVPTEPQAQLDLPVHRVLPALQALLVLLAQPV